MPEDTIRDDYLIEDNLIKCLSPLNYMQNVLAAARVKIKNNSITNTTNRDVAYSIFWILLSTYSCYVFQEFFFRAYFHENMLLYFSCFIGNGMQCLSYNLTTLMNKLSQRDNNVKIYLMLQKVDKILCLQKSTYYTNFQFRWNMIVSILITVCFLSGYAVNATVLLEQPLLAAFFAFGVLTMIMDNVLGFAMIYYLMIRAKILNSVIKNRVEEYKENVQKKIKQKTLKKFIFSLMKPSVRESSINDLSREKWLECLQDLLNSYKIITELFSFSVFNLSLTILVWTFIVIAAVVVGVRSGLYPVAATVTLILWASFYYFQLVSSAIVNDWFISEIKKMKLLCIRLISYNYHGPYQKTASSMVKIIHYNMPVFNVYGIFVLDKHLVIRLLGVIASNVLILIQFII